MSDGTSGEALRPAIVEALKEIEAVRTKGADAARERRDALARLVRARGVCEMRELPGDRRGGQFGCDVVALQKAGAIYLHGLGESALVAADPRRLPAKAVGLPLFEVGRGERRDECAQYEGCLDRFFERHGKMTNKPAQCPKDCASFELVPAHVRHELARAYVAKSRADSEPAEEEEAD